MLIFKTAKKILGIIILLAIVIAASIFSYKQYYNYKFNTELQELAKISPDYWDEQYKDNPIKDKYKVVFITNNGGEFTYAEYFKFAAERIGWEVQIYYSQTLGNEPEILKFDPDFIIFSQFSVNVPDLNTKLNAHRSKKYLLSFSSIDALRNRFKWISAKNLYSIQDGVFGRFIGLVHGVLTIDPNVSYYQKLFEKRNKQFFGLRLLPLVPEFNNEPAEAKSLMWLSGGWDKYRSSSNYQKFIGLLSENMPMKIYGHYNSSSYIKKTGVYGGYIPPGVENIEAIRQNGIYLLTHSNLHFQGGEPNMRGFEATAANAIVIADKHPFIVENFGDSFLYFDYDQDAETMYAQVKAHVDWINNNPEKAKEMAARAHQIFLEKFTIEKDLVRIAKMHEAVVKYEEEMGISPYHLGY